MPIKIDGTPFVLPNPEEAQSLVQEAFDNSKVPIQPRWVTHQKNRVVKQLEGLLECLGQMGKSTTDATTEDEPVAADAGKGRGKNKG